MGWLSGRDDVCEVAPMEQQFLAIPLEGEFANQEIPVWKCVDIREHLNQCDDLEDKTIWFIHAMMPALTGYRPEGFGAKLISFFRKTETWHEFTFAFAYTPDEAEEIYNSTFRGNSWEYLIDSDSVVPCTLKHDPHFIDRMFDSYFCEYAMHHGKWDEVEEFDDETIDRAAISLAARESLYK